MRTLVLGGGICGLATALMLARDGHDVTVLERDGDPVPDAPEGAWEAWQRTGVVQFRQAHFLQPRGRQVLDEELPDVTRALEAAGALRLDVVSRMPPTISDRAPRPGDERFVTWTGRRTTLELAMARIADAELDVRRGVKVTGVEPNTVVTASGERLTADLIVDAMGRGSTLPKLLGAPVHEEAEDCGFLYYTRFFRGTLPEPRAAALMPVGTFSILALPGDAGTWSVTLFASARDQPLKRLRDAALWTEVVRACPRHAHWLDGEPITGVVAMGGVIDRYRDPVPVPGLVSVADAWACTNPSLGRGISLGLAHAALLRRTVREQGDFAEATERELTPYYRATVASDRARLAEMDALRNGHTPPAPDDLRGALPRGMGGDPEVFRAALGIMSCLALPEEVFARPGMAERVRTAAADANGAASGPTRDQVLKILASAR
jgi:2-polyprenyl-6-methoxyphenol hydroxylase-like FAD-dependent oxidoreductase